MDESGFNIDEKQAMKMLIHLNNIQKYKVVIGKQEWITDIECINIIDKVITPILIFKNKYINI